MNSYFFIDSEGKQCGPFSPEELKNQSITPETMVWASGMPDWVQAQNVTELSFIFQGGVSSATTTTDSSSQYAPQNDQQYNQPSQQTTYGTPSQQYNQQPYNNNQGYNQQPYNQGQQQGGYNNFNNSLNSSLPIPKTWFVESILATIFCCLPFGVAGIINANKVESLYYSGDYEGSLKASKDAAKWTKISFFLAIAFWVVYILFYVVIIGVAMSSGSY